MRQFRLIAAAVALAATAILPTYAQTPGAGRPAAQPAAPAAGGGATGRVAVLDSSMFGGDEKGNGGIARVVNASKTLSTQFQPAFNELQQMQQRYNSLVEQIQKTTAVANPQTLAQQQQQAEDLQVQIKRKQEDLQRQVDARRNEVMGPLQEDVYKSLQAYAQQRGISVIIDVTRVPVIYFADSIDITRDFINEYNRTHPASAAAASPASGNRAPAPAAGNRP